jgi:hypothetical protein
VETPFLICAILGGTFLLCQLAAGLFGFGADHDTDSDTGVDGEAHDGHGDGFLGLLTVRSVTAGIMFFGLVGSTALQYGVAEPAAIGLALAGGAGALYGVALLMKSLTRLQADGTVRIDRAVGCPATVYLRVPGANAGPGKVHLSLQNRTVEYQAVTPGSELPTGTPVKVVAVIGPDTVEVEAA